MGNKHGKSGSVDDTVLTQEAVQLLMCNTDMTADQIIAFHKQFINDCPTGRLTPELFKKVFRELFHGKNPDKLCEISFKHFDQDGNGTIDFYEFLCAIAASQSGNSKTKWDNAFDMYDLNKNGQLEDKELKQVLKFIADAHGRKLDVDTITGRMLERAGKQAEKSINRDDFSTFIATDREFNMLLE